MSSPLMQAGVPLLSMAVSLLLAEKAIDTKLMVKASRDLISLLTCRPVACGIPQMLHLEIQVELTSRGTRLLILRGATRQRETHYSPS